MKMYPNLERRGRNGNTKLYRKEEGMAIYPNLQKKESMAICPTLQKRGRDGNTKLYIKEEGIAMYPKQKVEGMAIY